MNKENEKLAPCIYEEMSGIDLNRNYDWEFNITSIAGSSDNPCSETYRGPYPFSEPETQAIKRLIETKKNELQGVFFFHAYGNLFINPFGSDGFDHSRLLTQFPAQARIYREIWEDNSLPHGNIKGNAMKTVSYPVSGDAADWVLGK